LCSAVFIGNMHNFISDECAMKLQGSSRYNGLCAQDVIQFGFYGCVFTRQHCPGCVKHTHTHTHTHTPTHTHTQTQTHTHTNTHSHTHTHTHTHTASPSTSFSKSLNNACTCHHQSSDCLRSMM